MEGEAGWKNYNNTNLLESGFACGYNTELIMIVEVRDMRDDSFRIIFPKYSRWIEMSANEAYSLPCLGLDEFKKLMGNKIRPLPEDDFKTYLQNLTDDEWSAIRDSMAGNIAPGNEKIYR